MVSSPSDRSVGKYRIGAVWLAGWLDAGDIILSAVAMLLLLMRRRGTVEGRLVAAAGHADGGALVVLQHRVGQLQVVGRRHADRRRRAVPSATR